MSLWEQLLQHSDIVRPPDRNGEAWAWCPWHDDKKPGGTPNLGINPQKKQVHCFNCGEGGAGEGGAKKLAKAWRIELPDARTKKAPAPYMSAEAATQALKDAYGLRDETLEKFQIVADTRAVPGNKSTRGAWKYPTRAGTRFKAFDRNNKPKYWWARGTKKEKRQGDLYGLRAIPKGTHTVYLVNGEPSVWVCHQAGVPAVCRYGEGAMSEEAFVELAEWGVQHVRVVLDIDAAGLQGTRKAVNMARSAALEASAGELPDYLGAKGDAADLYQWHKCDDQAFSEAMASLPERRVPPEELQDERFFISKRRFFARQQTRDGELEIELTNFVAWAEEELMLDDGWQQTLQVNMAGKLYSGADLPTVQISSSQMRNVDWIYEKWGVVPTIKAGNGYKDSVRECVQKLSNQKGIRRRTIYQHTGWRNIDGKWYFLTPGGAIGASGVEVQLPEGYNRYRLPTAPTDAREAVRKSLGFLDVGDRLVTLPMLAFAYLAPLQSILMPAFTLWIRANSGSFKSTLAALLMCHFGEFAYNTPPATWEASVRGLERFLFDLKDCLGWVDDFNPRQSDSDMKRQYEKGDTVIRSTGNSQGRIRMRADLQLQKTYAPRAMLLSTGEIYPIGESVLARLFSVDYGRGDIDKDRLGDAQEQAGWYSQAMAAYILWLGERYDKLAAELPGTYAQMRLKAARADNSDHARIPGNVAALQIGLDMLADFAVETGAATQEEMARLSDEGWEVFRHLADLQKSRLTAERPAERFLNILDSLLGQGKIAAHRKGVDATVPPNVDLVGWYDDDYLYLDPEASWNRVSRFVRDEGRTLGTSEQGLRTSLLEDGVLEKFEDGHLTKRIRVNGRIHRVMLLRMDKVPFAEHFRHE